MPGGCLPLRRTVPEEKEIEMADVYEGFEKNGYKVEIMRDEDPESPREWDNLGRMLCFHKRHTLGDKLADLPFTISADMFNGWAEVEAYLEKQGAVIILPLYLYDHSGLRIKVGSFQGLLPQGHAEFDSGQIGFIIALREDMKKEYGVKRLTKKHLARATKLLEGEVETYDQFLRGDVWGYSIQDRDGEVIDSCWGYYGLEECRKAAEAAVPDAPAPLQLIDEMLVALKEAEVALKAQNNGNCLASVLHAIERAEKEKED